MRIEKWRSSTGHHQAGGEGLTGATQGTASAGLRRSVGGGLAINLTGGEIGAQLLRVTHESIAPTQPIASLHAFAAMDHATAAQANKQAAKMHLAANTPARVVAARNLSAKAAQASKAAGGATQKASQRSNAARANARTSRAIDRAQRGAQATDHRVAAAQHQRAAVHHQAAAVHHATHASRAARAKV